MPVERQRVNYLLLVITVVILGLSSRRLAIGLPQWLNLYLGDILWALMVFFILGLLFSQKSPQWVAVMAILFAFGVEISQLYHSPSIDALRRTRIGGLVLGYGFLWRDLFSYSIGVGIGVLLERFLILKKWIKG